MQREEELRELEKSQKPIKATTQRTPEEIEISIQRSRKEAKEHLLTKYGYDCDALLDGECVISRKKDVWSQNYCIFMERMGGKNPNVSMVTD